MNFVFFFPDEMRASSVSCYGNRTVKMPNFDKLAEDGVRFENCIVQNPVCSPSRCSLMTGWYVHNMGHRSLWHLLRPHEPSLFRYMKNAGYDIQWFGKNDLYSQAYLDEICDDIQDKRNGYRTKPSRKTGTVHSRINPYKFEDPEFYSFLMAPVPEGDNEILLEENIARAIDFLNGWKDGDRPFMLYLPIIMPHPPYSALKRYQNMYEPNSIKEELKKIEDTTGKPSYVELIRRLRRMDQLDLGFYSKVYAAYLGMNSYVDFLLGELMKVINEKGFNKNTTVIVSSDHGDWAGNHGLVEKWPNAMDDDLIKVPLIIKSPGNSAGHVVEEQVALFDIMQTILDLAGIKEGHAHFAKSLVPQLNGHKGNPTRMIFAEGGYDSRDERCFEYHHRSKGPNILMDPEFMYYPKTIQQKDYPESVCRTTMLRTLTHKLVMRTSGENELYDLKKDPDEMINVYDKKSYEGIQKMLEKEMLNWYIETADVVPQDEDHRGFNINSHF